MKLIAFALILICISTLFSQTTIPAGNVSGTWDLAGSPYLIEGEIEIPNEETLTIDPGCLIEFQGHYEFKIFGKIIAEGIQQDSIKFTAADANTGWFGIRFQEVIASADTSKFSNCIFENGKATGVATYLNGGAIYVFSGNNLIVTNCRFSDNYANHDGGAIFCRDSNLQISGCTFKYNVANQERGGAINVDNSVITIDNTDISNNQSGNHGGAVYCRNSEFVIINSMISNNFDYGGTSGGLYLLNSNIEIYNNILHNNSSDPFFDSEGTIKMYNCEGTVNENTFYNNYFDFCSLSAAIYCSYSELDIIENTIYGNEGSGIVINSSESYILNNTIYGNEFYGVSIYGGSNVVVDSNELYNNEEDGIILQQSSARIEKNVINGNEDGISITNDSSPLIRNNVICDNLNYGVYIDESNPIIINSTIANNATRSIETDSDCSLILINSILWGNQYSPISGSWQNQLYISNCCIDRPIANITPLIFENNINDNPEFVGSEYFISFNSPCIDAGTEWMGLDKDGSIIDIGCYTPNNYAGIGQTPPNIITGSISGEISENIMLMGDVVVESGENLIMAPGTEVNCMGNFTVSGSIEAIGTIALPILFSGIGQFPWNGIEIESNSSFINSFNYCSFTNSTSSALSVYDSNINVNNCDFYDNTASNGGAIYAKINDENIVSINITNNQFDCNQVYENGGAINIDNRSDVSMIQISNNSFTSNHSDNMGGALYTYSYTGNMTHNFNISNNEFFQNQASRGGGGWIGCNADVHDNSFINNQASSIGGGVCIYNSVLNYNFIDGNTANIGGGIDAGKANVVNNIISGNSANKGGGISTSGSEIEKNKTICNLIINNQAQYEGGGIYVSGENIINNCTIVSNASNSGAGIYCENSFNSEMQNCIIFDNEAIEDTTQIYLFAYWFHDYDPGSHTEIHEWRPANLNIYYSNIEGGYDNIYLNYDGSTPEYPINYDLNYENNINNEPLFLNPDNGDFYLLDNSPCINAGTPDTTELNLPECDLGGNPRIFEDIIDMGCYEYQYAYPAQHEIDFGQVLIQTMSEPQEIVIFNPFNENIMISSITTSDQCYVKTSNDSMFYISLENIVLEPSSESIIWCTLNLNEEGKYTGEITVNSDNFSLNNTIQVTAIGYSNPIPEYELDLYQNYPNPFNPNTRISFSLPETSKATIVIYNLKGQKIKTLINNKCEKGITELIWNGNDTNHKSVSSGIYFYQLKVDDKVQKSKKMMLLK